LNLLTPDLKKAGFLLEHLAKVAAHDGGSKNLETLNLLTPDLKKAGFLLKHLAKVAAHNGGSKNLETLNLLTPDLKKAGFLLEHLAKVAAHDGGSILLTTLANHIKASKDKVIEQGKQWTRLDGKKRTALLNMLSHRGGDNNRKVLKKYKLALKKTGFLQEDLNKVAAHDSGADNLKMLNGYQKVLNNAGFSRKALVKVAAHNGGSKNLKMLYNLQKKLMEVGFSLEHLVEVAANCGGSKNLETLYNLQKKLMEVGFLLEHLVKVAAYNGGSKNLETLYNLQKKLMEVGFSLEHLVEVAAHNGGSKNLETLNLLKPDLKKAGFSLEHLVKVAAHNGGSKNLETLNLLTPDLKKAGFLLEHLAKVAAHDGGSKNLETLHMHQGHLKKFNLSGESKIIKMLQRKTGHRRLDFFIQYYPLFYQNQYEGVSELLNLCSVSILLKENTLQTILALKALLYPLKKSIKLPESLTRWVCKQFSEKFLVSILETANENLKDKGIILTLKSGKTHYGLSTSIDDIPGIVQQIEHKLKQFNLTDRLKLQKLLDPKNMVYYRLLSNPNDNAALYGFDIRPWKAIFYQQNLTNTKIAKLFKQGIQEKEIEVEGIEDETLIRQITTEGQPEYVVLLPVALIDTIMNDHFNFPAYQLIISDGIPSDAEVKPNYLYLYKTEIALEAIIKRGNKSEIMTFPPFSFTPQQDKELSASVDSSKLTVKLCQSTLSSLSRCCFELRKNFYVFAENNEELFEFMDDASAFFSGRQSKQVTVTKRKESKTLRVDAGCLSVFQPSHLPVHASSPQKRPPEPVNLLSMPTFEDFMTVSLLEEPPTKQLKLTENVSQALTMTKRKISHVDAGCLSVFQPSHLPVHASSPQKRPPEPVNLLSMPTFEDFMTVSLLEEPPTKQLKLTENVSQALTMTKRKISHVDAGCLSVFQPSHLPVHASSPQKRPPEPVNLLSMPTFEDFMTVSLPEEPPTKQLKLTENVSKANLASIPLIGEGSYNRVYRYGEYVYKQRKNTALAMDDPERSVRIFNEVNVALNGETEEKAEVIDKHNLWKQRFIKGRMPSGLEMAEIILKIFLETKRIYLDAYCKDNILKEKDTGKVYCPDPGLMIRRGSVSSDDYWFKKEKRNTHYEHMHKYLKRYIDNKEMDSTRPIFCIMGLDFYDKHLLQANDQDTPSFRCNTVLPLGAVLSLGMAAYVSVLLKRTLNTTACLNLLEGKLKLSPDTLLSGYTGDLIENLATQLQPLFLSCATTKKPSQCHAHSTIFKPTKNILEGEEKPLSSHAKLPVLCIL